MPRKMNSSGVRVPQTCATLSESSDIVASLLKRPFFKRSQIERRNIIASEPPTPKLVQHQRYKDKTRMFCVSWYEKNKWLCGSLTKMKLFCWPCLLLSTKLNVWTFDGYIDLKNIAAYVKKHARNEEHLRCFLAYKEMRRERFEELSQIIGNLVDFASKLRNGLDQATIIVKENLNPVLNELLDAMVQVCQEEIGKQTKQTNFLAIQVEQIMNRQLVIIFRYVFEGQIFERFWGLTRPKEFTAESIANAVFEELEKLGVVSIQLKGVFLEKVADKLIALSYQGAPGMGKEILRIIRNKCANAVHFYTYPGDLRLEVEACSEEGEEIFNGHEAAASLLCPDFFQTYKNNFPEKNFAKTFADYPFFDVAKLRNELTIIYSRTGSSFNKDWDGIFPIFTFIHQNDLKKDFSETYKLLEIICTIPMTTNEPNRCFFTLNKVKCFLQKKMAELRVDALAMLAIEKELVQQIPDFNDRVLKIVSSRKTISYSPSSTSDGPPPLIVHDATVIKEECDDTFDETFDEVSPVTKEELADILNQSQLSAGTETGIVDLPSISEPPHKKSRLDILPNGDKSGSVHQLSEETAQEFNDKLNDNISKKIKDDRDLVGMIDSSGNIDLFFQSMAALAKTLSPLDQILLQKNVADVVFRMKIAQLTKSDLTKSS